MTYIEIFLLAIALSVDAFVVSFTYGLIFSKDRMKNSLLISSSTGFFQGLMPIIGYYLTSLVKSYIAPYAKITVFLIFTYLGIKFIFDATKNNKEKPLCLDVLCLLLIGIATSIDAFSAGISLLLFGNKILKPALLITLITFINSNLGFYLGEKLKHIPSKYLEISAGIILIFLGIKAFF